MKTLIIGLSGQAGSGKDTLGNYLIPEAERQKFTVIRRGFADALKEEVAEFLTRYNYQEIKDFLNEHCTDNDIFDLILTQTFEAPPRGQWQKLCAFFGRQYVWDYRPFDAALLVAQMNDRMYKERYRALLQWWATEYRREQFDPNYWLNCLEGWLDKKAAQCEKWGIEALLFYIPDIRFPNEVAFVQKKMEGYIIRILRPGHAPAMKHKSEHLLNDYKGFNLTVINNRGPKELATIGTTAFLNACSWKWGNAGDAA